MAVKNMSLFYTVIILLLITHASKGMSIGHQDNEIQDSTEVSLSVGKQNYSNIFDLYLKARNKLNELKSSNVLSENRDSDAEAEAGAEAEATFQELKKISTELEIKKWQQSQVNLLRMFKNKTDNGSIFKNTRKTGSPIIKLQHYFPEIRIMQQIAKNDLLYSKELLSLASASPNNLTTKDLEKLYKRSLQSLADLSPENCQNGTKPYYSNNHKCRERIENYCRQMKIGATTNEIYYVTFDNAFGIEKIFFTSLDAWIDLFAPLAEKSGLTRTYFESQISMCRVLALQDVIFAPRGFLMFEPDVPEDIKPFPIIKPQKLTDISHECFDNAVLEPTIIKINALVKEYGEISPVREWLMSVNERKDFCAKNTQKYCSDVDFDAVDISLEYTNKGCQRVEVSLTEVRSELRNWNNNHYSNAAKEFYVELEKQLSFCGKARDKGYTWKSQKLHSLRACK